MLRLQTAWISSISQRQWLRRSLVRSSNPVVAVSNTTRDLRVLLRRVRAGSATVTVSDTRIRLQILSLLTCAMQIHARAICGVARRSERSRNTMCKRCSTCVRALRRRQRRWKYRVSCHTMLCQRGHVAHMRTLLQCILSLPEPSRVLPRIFCNDFWQMCHLSSQAVLMRLAPPLRSPGRRGLTQPKGPAALHTCCSIGVRTIRPL